MLRCCRFPYLYFEANNIVLLVRIKTAEKVTFCICADFPHLDNVPILWEQNKIEMSISKVDKTLHFIKIVYLHKISSS